GMDDADWKAKNAEDTKVKIDSLFSFIEKNLRDAVVREPDHLDRWMLSVTHQKIEAVTASLEVMRTRRALSIALSDVWNDIRWYLRREEAPRKETLSRVFEAWIRLLAPFTPFAAEELNRKVMGGKGLISTADWPSSVDFPLDERAEVSELLVNTVIDDAR